MKLGAPLLGLAKSIYYKIRKSVSREVLVSKHSN